MAEIDWLRTDNGGPLEQRTSKALECDGLPTARIAAADQAAVGVATTTGVVATTRIIARSRDMNT
jgi:hypothetical protein